jgi:hypothetical protein
MLDSDDMALWYALNRLTTNYWFEVDFNGGTSAHEFYLADALFVVGDNRFEGQDKIRAFYTKRQQRGPITGRHVVTNLQVTSTHEHRASLVGVLTLYYAKGRPPHHGPHPPALVADIAADCVRGGDERWRYRSHVLSPLFIGNAMPISLSVDSGRI